MSRFGRAGRRPDQWRSPHERARVRAAERLEAPLKQSEEVWLEAHLKECPACAAIAAAYATDRAMLRRLRDANPEPPRDLWARTAAGIEREAAVRGRRRRTPVSAPPPSRPAVGALSALAVVAVVLVATALSGGFFGDHGIALASSHPGGSPAVSLRAAPTAIAVGAGQVRWLGVRDDGAFAYNVANIDAVCPLDRQPDCAPFADGHARPVTLTAIPKFVFQSPVDDQAVVVGTDAAGADAIIVVALPAPEPSVAPVPDGSATTEGPLPSVAMATVEPTPTPVPVPSSEPSESPDIRLAPSSETTAEPTDQPFASASPGVEPSAGTAVAIITNVTVVGRGAGYSPDGAWFAFSARPVDGSAGPDIYVWHVGDPLAVALTSDHASVFASWVGNQLLGSRATPADAASPDSSEANPFGEPLASVEPAASPTPTPTPLPTPDASAGVEASALPEPTPVPEFVAQTFLIDPLSGNQTPMLGADWQPVVDPTGVWVTAWEGTVRSAADGFSMVPATGRLVIHPFQALADPAASPGSSDQPSESASTQPTDLPSDQPAFPTDASPTPSAGPTIEPQVIAEGPIAEFDARWDDTGTWLAVWIADAVDPSIGRLSLLHVDPTTGLIDRPLGAPQDVPALPGFSIGAGRLAWATPPGQGGEGSRIQIVAWTEDAVGAVESIPVEGAIVIQ
jgi:predicted anti-sigma-YlaC factor YlaD